MSVFRATYIALAFVFLAAASFNVVAQESDPVCDEGECSTSTREGVGLVMNGGVFVGACGAAAWMRGIQMQKVMIDGEERPAMQAIDYISGLSGGNIPTLLYSYAQNANADELLDANFRVEHPSQITPAALNRKPRKSIFQIFTKSVSKKLFPLFVYYIAKFGSVKSVWPLTIWWAILKPYGIRRNQLFGTKSDNYDISPRDDVRSESLINFAMVGSAEDKGVEMTQNFFDAMFELDRMNLGGTFKNLPNVQEVVDKLGNYTFQSFTASASIVETGFSLPSVKKSGEVILPSPEGVKPSAFGADSKNKNHFSLELALGMGTNFATYLIPPKVKDTREKLPELFALGNAFSQQRMHKFGNMERNMLFADDGFVNPGTNFAALLRRNVKHIIYPVWRPESANIYSEVYENSKDRTLSEWAGLVPFFSMAFGFYPRENVDFRLAYMTHVFDHGEVHLEKLRNNFDALYLADKPLVYTLKDVKVIDNPYQGVVGGDTVDITIFYVTMPKSFAKSIPYESVPPPKGVNETVDERGRFTNEELKDFPMFKGTDTSGANPIKVALRFGTLSTKQTNMMAYLGGWLMEQAWEGVSIDGNEYFGGFKKILESP